MPGSATPPSLNAAPSTAVQMARCASEVGDMMVLIADTLLPRNEDADFEPFLQRSLGG